ncbi:glycosyltransferase [Novipirellula rosea]
MSTYNGEKFLREQLDSLAAQTCLPLELVVGDDRSTDNTVAILESFAATAPFPVSISVNEKNLGFADNFLATASRCKGDWVAFCDQDDVWLPNRIADAASEVERGDEDLMLVVQAAELVDASLNKTGRRLPDIRRRRIVPPNGHYGFWQIAGFSQTVRSKLLSEFDWSNRPISEHPCFRWQPHDKWACMLANALGKTAYLPQVAALYRRHESTVTGDYERQSLTNKIATASTAGEDQYRFLQRVAHESRDTLLRLSEATTDATMKRRLVNGAEAYNRLAIIQLARADIHGCQSLGKRLSKLAGNIKSGVYFGSPFTARGLSSLAKDISVALGKSRVPSENASQTCD